jgi:hypothetical protein
MGMSELKTFTFILALSLDAALAVHYLAGV